MCQEFMVSEFTKKKGSRFAEDADKMREVTHYSEELLKKNKREV